MGLLILIIIILWGWAEVTAFFIVSGEIGGFLTFIGVFLTAFLGLWLLRSQATSVLVNLKQQVTLGRPPLSTIPESMSLLIAGIFMLIPGYVTDGLGLLLFVPGLRKIIGVAIMSRLLKNATFRSFASSGGASFHGRASGPQWSGQHQDDNTIIEGEAEEKSSEADSLPGKK
jgi:UPF0716 protein FxsA